MPDGQTGNRSNATNSRRGRTFQSATYVRHGAIDILPSVSDNGRAALKKSDFSLHAQAKLLHKSNQPLLRQDVRSPLPAVKSRVAPAPQPALPRQKPSLVLHRSGFGPKMAKTKRSKLKRPHKSRSFYAVRGMALVIFLCGIGVSVNAWHINRIASTQAVVLAKTTGNGDSDNIPVEEEPGANANATYRVALDLPRILTIPKLQVNARIQRLGVKTNNELRVPGNIFDVGWYEGSSKPGEGGTIVLDGYISGPTKHGVFYSLANLSKGDDITLERGDGQEFHYKVVKQDSYDYDKVDMPAVLTSVQPGKPGLNIMSSSGRFDVRTNKFEKRVVVFAVLSE